MKIRHDDKLSNLDSAARSKLDEWLSDYTYRKVVELARAELGLQTNIRALSVYYNKYLAPSPVHRLVKLAESNPAAAEAAATVLVNAHALKAASSPDLDV